MDMEPYISGSKNLVFLLLLGGINVFYRRMLNPTKVLVQKIDSVIIIGPIRWHNSLQISTRAILNRCSICHDNKQKPKTISASSGIYFSKTVFVQSQMYVAMSSVTSKSGMQILICDDESCTINTTNIMVFKEVFKIYETFVNIVNTHTHTHTHTHTYIG
ncbi:unnamed protein product, partial [Cuscuta epithymum]